MRLDASIIGGGFTGKFSDSGGASSGDRRRTLRFGPAAHRLFDGCRAQSFLGGDAIEDGGCTRPGRGAERTRQFTRGPCRLGSIDDEVGHDGGGGWGGLFDDRAHNGAPLDERHPVQEHHRGEAQRGSYPEEERRASLCELNTTECRECERCDECAGDHHTGLTAGAGTPRLGLHAGGQALAPGRFHRKARGLEFCLVALALRLAREFLLSEGPPCVQLDAHFLGGLCRLREDAQGLVEANGVALGSLKLMARVPRRQEVHQPQHDGNEEDDTAPENLFTHGENGTAESVSGAVAAPCV